MEDDLKKKMRMEENLNNFFKLEFGPKQKWKTTYKKMEDDIKKIKWKTTSKKNGRQPQTQFLKINLNWL